jgi:hypothetical protein
MKVLFSIAVLFGVLSVAQANSVVFDSPSALNSIDGNNNYTWGIGWTLPTGNQITGATLTYNNIQLTSFGQSNPGILWTHLLNTSTANGSITTGTDNDNPTDAFAGSGLLLGERFFPTLNTKATFSYNIDLATLTSYLADGKFGIGIDPDCHYTDDSITLAITYGATPSQHVPEVTSTGLLLGSTFSLLLLFRRKIASRA